MLDRIVQIDGAMPALLPAMEIVAAERIVAGAEDTVRRIDPRFNRRHAHDHLECGAWRIHAGEALVHQRQIRAFEQRLILGRAIAHIELIGVVGRRRDKRDDVARMYVENDRAGGLARPKGLL